VQADRTEPIGLLPLCVLRLAARAQFRQRLIEVAARHIHGRGKPVRERKSLIHPHHAPRGAQVLATPAHKRQNEPVAPLVQFERNGPARSGDRLLHLAEAMQHERHRAPGIT